MPRVILGSKYRCTTVNEGVSRFPFPSVPLLHHRYHQLKNDWPRCRSTLCVIDFPPEYSGLCRLFLVPEL